VLTTLEQVSQAIRVRRRRGRSRVRCRRTVPDGHLYASLVEDFASERLRGETKEEEKAIEGPFSNPRIEPFDLQEPTEQ
jgi:hypothetical protein